MVLYFRLFAILLCLNLVAQSGQVKAEGFGSQYHPSQYRPHHAFQPQHQRLNSHRGFTIELSELGDLMGFSDVRPRLSSRQGGHTDSEDDRIGYLADRLLPEWMGEAIEESAEVIFSANDEKRGFRPRCKYDSAPAFLQDALQQAHYQVNLYGNTSTFVVGWLF
ncbi:hypothetical protein [Allohahella marinimesophila]|uniref:Uncharacterized protein n=1 Tax=Allohahella marinimesophila TaxID=1054972 RepID=A0ABP7Q733_9GAMM